MRRHPGIARPALALAAVLAAWALLDRLALPGEVRLPDGGALYRARVVPPPAGSPAPPGDVVFVRPAAGPARGRVVQAVYAATAPEVLSGLVGKSVFVEVPPGGERGVVRAVARDRLFLALAAGLVGLIVIVAGSSAWRLLMVLAAGVGCLVVVLVPALTAGMAPLAAGLLAAGAFTVVAAALIGRGRKLTLGILAGAGGGLLAATCLALLVAAVGRLTGVYSSLTKDLWYDPNTRWLDFRQLLSAGMIVGACGIILDLATAVASAIGQVAEANPALTRRQLAAAGLAVGRDVMGTELNTLIFAYAGAHFGVLLLPTLGSALRGFEIPALRIFSQQDVAIEVFQMLVGTTALVLTIPITAAVSAALSAGKGGGEVPPLPDGGRRRARLVAWVAVAGVLLAAWGGCLWWHRRAYHRYAPRPTDKPNTARYLVQGKVLATDPPPEALIGERTAEELQKALCVLSSGPPAGQQATVPNPISGFPGHDKLLRTGDRVLLQARTLGDKVTYVTVMDFSRGDWLITLAFVLVATVLAVGGVQGLRALAALALGGAVLYPAVLAVAGWRWNGLATFLAASLPLCAGVFLILAGPSRKAVVGSAGAFGGMLAGGVCAVSAAAAVALTGLASDSMVSVRMFTGSAGIDYLGLLQAGMVLGVAGAAMDVAIAVASAVHQVRLAKPDAGRGELLRRGLTVGRGIMIPMVLVLTFAYIGLNLPILILPRMLPGQHPSLLVSNERISVEVLRILVGGIGVVSTVPITAAVAALAGRPGRKETRATPGHNHPGAAGGGPAGPGR